MANPRSFASIVPLALSCFLITSCLVIPKDQIPQFKEVPETIQNPARIVVARKKKPLWSGPTYALSLDGQAVAKLRAGQYTEIFVDPGWHTIGVVWFVGEQPLGVGGPGGGLFFGFVGTRYSREIEVELERGVEYLFLISTKQALKGEDMVQINQCANWPEDMEIEKYTLTPTWKDVQSLHNK